MGGGDNVAALFAMSNFRKSFEQVMKIKIKELVTATIWFRSGTSR